MTPDQQQTARRVLSALKDGPLPVADICQRLGAYRDVVQPILHDLDDAGLVRLAEGTGIYRLSKKGEANV